MDSPSDAEMERLLGEKKVRGRSRVGGRPKKIENAMAREVTFSKRRAGLFGKASELSIACGAEIAIILFSPHGNPFVFGSHPYPDHTLDRYLRGECEFVSDTFTSLDSTDHLKVEEQYKRCGDDYGRAKKEYEDVLKKVEAIKIRKKSGKDSRSNGVGFWWDDMSEEVMDDMDTEEVEYCVANLEKLKDRVRGKLEEVINTKSNPTFKTDDLAGMDFNWVAELGEFDWVPELGEFECLC